MVLSTSIIDLDSIRVTPSSPLFEDKRTEVEALAHTIIQLKSLVRIPIVRALGVGEYELVSGHLEYYAFLKAREIDSDIADRITVFILKPSDQPAALEQLEISQAVNKIPSSIDSKLTLQISNLEARIERQSIVIEQLKINIAEQFEQLKNEILTAIDAKMPQPLPPLEAFNRILEPLVQEQTFRNLIFLGKKKAMKIIERLQDYRKNNKDKEFKGFSDVLKALGKGILSEKKLLEVIDHWSS